MRIGAVIAAAGIPGGFAVYDRSVHADGPEMVKRMIQAFYRAGVEDIVVVTGYRAKETEKYLSKLGAVFLRSENYENEQMLDYAVRGFAYLRQRCEKMFFCPADVPLFSADTVQAMMETPGPVVVPVYNGKKGHPILIDSGLLDNICSYKGKNGLKGAVDDSGAETVLIPVEDPGVAVRAGTGSAFEQMASCRETREIYPRVKVQLMGKTPFFGPGLATLLRQIEVLGSVREACEKTGMSYSKGRGLIRTAERELEYVIVERSPGGKGGGTACVTPKGKELLEKYELFEKRVAGAAGEEYRRIFGG